MVLVLGIVKGLSKYWYLVLLRPFMKIGGIVKASLEILGIGIGVKKGQN